MRKWKKVLKIRCLHTQNKGREWSSNLSLFVDLYVWRSSSAPPRQEHHTVSLDSSDRSWKDEKRKQGERKRSGRHGGEENQTKRMAQKHNMTFPRHGCWLSLSFISFLLCSASRWKWQHPSAVTWSGKRRGSAESRSGLTMIKQLHINELRLIRCGSYGNGSSAGTLPAWRKEGVSGVQFTSISTFSETPHAAIFLMLTLRERIKRGCWGKNTAAVTVTTGTILFDGAHIKKNCVSFF